MEGIAKSKGFKSKNVRMIVDDDDSVPDPSGHEVKKALHWLCTGREAGDIIFFHFSGHGTQLPCDGDDEEEDGMDEAIVLEEMFLMVDDDLKEYFKKLPPGCRVTCVTDCCHSGSMLDGEMVMIEGPKSDDEEEEEEESDDQHESILGGTREFNHSSRSLPIETLAGILGGNLGHDVDATSGGIHGAIAEKFGKKAGRFGKLGYLASKMFGRNKDDDGGSSSSSSSSGEDEGYRNASSDSSDSSCYSDYDEDKYDEDLDEDWEEEYEDEEWDDEEESEDVAVLITGCQSHETSADVTTNDGDAFGALTKTLSAVVAADPTISYYDLVSKVRSRLNTEGFSQNPCLECNTTNSDRRFIC